MPPAVDDIQAVSLPIQPPPPPRVVETESAAAPPDPAFGGFEASPSDSPVKIAASPPSFDAALSTDKVPAPRATIRVARMEGFKPQMDTAVSREHVYQASELDQVPHIIYRADPKVPSYVSENASMLRVMLYFVVDTKGEVGNVRVLQSSGNPQFDSIICASVKDWTFSPGVKKGKPVKSFIQQNVTIKWGSGSRFST